MRFLLLLTLLTKIHVLVDRYLFAAYNIDRYRYEDAAMNTTECVKILRALGGDTRMQIFEMLQNGKMCACNLLEKLQITQPTLSHHMKILCDCGIVLSEKEWKWSHYSINCSKLMEFLDYMGNTACRKRNV